ncbi:hypothetical protein KC360_g6034 [Hortaea werneckii]|nr:hypothetical protein KC325_g3915 [Hortaea werneckii]KAI6994251.1 hypothetical protein KC359_g4723 [Hortaea werneckii]KAI7143800.1 hypothetical protein KC344_g5972 [Hortaea werneckii]KAI7171590.1 hypothetical protein KC360_g6034 [Hortaea werneckii]
MALLQHILKLQHLAAWKWLSTRRQKNPESQGDQPSLVTPDEYLPGFEEVAAFISTEDEGGMYRRFRRLAARNLLYMQSELASLEDKLHKMDQGDRRRMNTPEGVDAFQCAIDWNSLRRLEPTYDKARERLALIMDIRKLMREYLLEARLKSSQSDDIQEAVYLDQRIALLRTPSKAYLTAFREFLGSRRDWTINVPGQPLGEVEQEEYAVTYSPDTDRLTRLIEQNIVKSRIKWFREKRNVPHSWQGVYYISDHMIEAFASIFAVTTAASLLIGGIAALDSARARDVRLGILAAFTVAFAAFVGLLTTAKRSELSAATAAYAAVLVVYVGKAS